MSQFEELEKKLKETEEKLLHQISLSQKSKNVLYLKLKQIEYLVQKICSMLPDEEEHQRLGGKKVSSAEHFALYWEYEFQNWLEKQEEENEQ